MTVISNPVVRSSRSAVNAPGNVLMSRNMSGWQAYPCRIFIIYVRVQPTNGNVVYWRKPVLKPCRLVIAVNPVPTDQPGYIRIDSVHQGDQDKRKGVYHINAVDEVTQFQIIITVERISERDMLPALEQLLAAFPFKIKGFHTDNGGEYINYTVAKLLEKLRIEFTKSRPRHSKASASLLTLLTYNPCRQWQWLGWKQEWLGCA